MPLPKPKKGEKKDHWLQRCMGNEAMNKEFSDNDQRYAVCNQKWRDKDKKKSSNEDYEMSKKKDLEPEIERRYFPISEFRVQRKEGEPLRFEGYAAKFNTLSEDLWGMKEKIAPGAFTETIQKADVRALLNHNPNYVLGRTKAGTLELEEDEKGLRMVNTPPDTQWVRDLAISVERGDIDQMSFGFRTIKDSWDESKKIPVRTLEQVDLKDVSIVTFPAYKTTKVQTRELMAQDGLDLDTIDRVWVKSQHGLKVNEDDCKDIDSIVESLNSLKPQDETINGVAGTGSELEQTHQKKILMRRRNLDLKERERKEI